MELTSLAMMSWNTRLALHQRPEMTMTGRECYSPLMQQCGLGQSMAERLFRVVGVVLGGIVGAWLFPSTALPSLLQPTGLEIAPLGPLAWDAVRLALPGAV